MARPLRDMGGPGGGPPGAPAGGRAPSGTEGRAGGAPVGGAMRAAGCSTPGRGGRGGSAGLLEMTRPPMGGRGASTSGAGVGADAGAGASEDAGVGAGASATGAAAGAAAGVAAGASAASATAGAGAGASATTGAGASADAAGAASTAAGAASDSDVADAFLAAPFLTGLGSSGCWSRVSPSRSALRRTRSACASMMLDEWLLTPMPSASHRSRVSLLVIPSSLASSYTRSFAAKFWSLFFHRPVRLSAEPVVAGRSAARQIRLTGLHLFTNGRQGKTRTPRRTLSGARRERRTGLRS